MRRIEMLREQWTKCRTALDAIESKAVDEGRELNEDELKQVDSIVTRSTELGEEIQKLSDRDSAARATADILARFDTEPAPTHTRGTAAASEPVMSPGEYVSLYCRAVINKDADAANELVRAVEADPTFTRVDAQEVISGNLGVVPNLIIGDVIKFVDANRYAVNAMREMPMPASGSTFIRPRVTQRTLAGAQASEFTALTSQQLLIEQNTVTKKTFGTVLDISEQDIDWTDPALLQIAIEDMAESYAIATETEATSDIVAAVTTNVTDYSLSSGSAGFFQAIASAASSLYGTAKRLPDVLFAAPDQWAYLVGLVDLQGRQVFPTLSPMNAPGTLSIDSFGGNPMGIKLVVSPEFTAGTLVLGVSQYLERYEQNKGFLQIPAPSTLSIVVAYRGYFAANVQAKAVQGIVGS